MTKCKYCGKKLRKKPIKYQYSYEYTGLLLPDAHVKCWKQELNKLKEQRYFQKCKSFNYR